VNQVQHRQEKAVMNHLDTVVSNRKWYCWSMMDEKIRVRDALEKRIEARISEMEKDLEELKKK